MRTLVILALAVVGFGCGPKHPPVDLSGRWPTTAEDYDKTTGRWTRSGQTRDQYQEILELAATFRSPEWRAAYASRDAYFRGLQGAAREARMAQAKADDAGPYEVELMVTTWDRRENDLDRGKKSIWRVVLLDDQDNEIEPIEIVKDKRPAFTVRSDFPAFGDFAVAYIARFPRDKQLLGPNVARLRLRMSSVRGFVVLTWDAKR
ncbi:MAG TPA: hypothetical protein VIV40_13460 [Kofleriaceae bacterium]